jgi:putative ATP-dependent DNA ligase
MTTNQAANTEHIEYKDFTYERHKKDREEIRGTLSFLGPDNTTVLRKVHGFPHIKRVYRLEEGIRRLFGNSPFWAEGKIDGYNTRIFQYDGKLYATTRGGFICPFTTEWARIWGEESHLNAFFKDFPDYVLCGEVVGDNPYNWQRDRELSPGAHIYVFDIFDSDGNFLLPEDRHELCRKYDLPKAPVLGKFTLSDIDRIYDLLRDLNARGREGVVLKSANDNRVLKFVTPESDLQDIEDSLRIGFDLSSGFFFNRYLRASLFVKELGLDPDEYARRIGQAFLNGTPPLDGFQEAGEQYTIYVCARETWDELYDMLKTRVLIKLDDMTEARLKNRNMVKIVFRRVYQKSTHRYKRILKGYLHQD